MTEWIQCDRCDACFKPEGMTVSTEDGYTVYHYICPECGYHGKDIVFADEPKEEEVNMNNYYTVSNTASRLNCGRNTVLRAIHDGTFTNTIVDRTVGGMPALMIPSDQVEWWKDHGGILKVKSRKTGQKAGSVARMRYLESLEEKDEPGKTCNEASGIRPDGDYDGDHGTEGHEMLPVHNAYSADVFLAQKDAIQKAQDDLNRLLEEKSHLTLQEVRDTVIPPQPTPGKIFIEIDASTIQKSVSDQFKAQVQGIRETVALLSDMTRQAQTMIADLEENICWLEAQL